MEDHFEGGREVEMRRRMRQAPDPLAMLRTVAARAADALRYPPPAHRERCGA
jgi:hypothetical protein